MSRKLLLIFSLLLLPLGQLWANEVSFTASAPSQLAVGERFRIVFAVNARPDNFNGPAFGEFRVLAGPSQSSSSSTQIIGGQVTRTESYSFTYILEATSEGSFTIPAAKVMVDGRQFESNPVSIRVSGQASAGTQPSSPPAVQPQTPAGQGIGDRDIFLRAIVSNSSPYQGQAVTLTYKLFTRVVVSQYSIEKLPAFQGFWAEDITPSGQPQVSEEVIDGQRYNVATIRQVVLFPQRAGELSIEPLDMQTLVRVTAPRRSGSLLDEFFGSSPFGAFQNVERQLRSNQVRLNVRSLPAQNRPASFKGMVGNFEMKASINPLEVNVNDPVTLTINISGSGNLKMLDKPEIQFPANLEAFDPNITDNVRVAASGVSGNRQFEYLLIPRTGGTYEIPAIKFSYFDPAAGRYITRTSNSYTIVVTGSSIASGDVISGARQEDVQYLASDIRFIKNQSFRLHPVGTLFFRSNLFYLLLISSIVTFGILLLLWRRQIKLASDKALMRNRKARKMAQRRLKKAGQFLKSANNGEFYDEIFRALWGYLSDKLDIQVSKLNKEAVAEVFAQRAVPTELADKFLETLNECEFARFAPGSPQSRMDHTYQRAMDTLITLEKELRNKRF